jgi:hypothetical protein
MRRRRVYGRRSVRIEVDRDMIAHLMDKRILPRDKRSDTAAIGEAVTEWLRVTRQYGGGA